MSNFKEKLNSYKDAILGNAIYDMIKLILVFLFGSGFVTFIGSILIDISKINLLIKYRFFILFLAVIITVYIILEIYTRSYKKHPTTPSVEADYEVIKRESSFTYGKDFSKYELYLQIKSKINNLSRIQGKYTWSGSGTATLNCETKHCRLIMLTRKDSFIEYEVELRKSYKKGKITECNIVGNMPDPEHKFIPFFSTQITEETKELIINICIPPIYGVREIICEEIAIVRNSNQNSEVVLLDAEGKYQWRIPNPKLFYKYSVRWEL